MKKKSNVSISCGVGSRGYLAIVDTGSSTSLISQNLAFVIRNPIAPKTNRLLGPGGKGIPIRGRKKVTVRIGDVETEDDFIVVDYLHPDILSELKFLVENKCRADTVESTFVVQKSGGSVDKEPMIISGTKEDDLYLETKPDSDEEMDGILKKEIDQIPILTTSELEEAEIKENTSENGARFEPGDLVWVFEWYKAESRKVYFPWRGPYKIIRRRQHEMMLHINSDNTVTIRLPSRFYVIIHLPSHCRSERI